jgi:hypothetical protein
MIVVSVGDLVDYSVDDLDTGGHRLYLIRDGEVVLYVGQSQYPIERLQLGHLGLDGTPGESKVGMLIRANLPEARTWQVEILTAADCEPLLKAQKPQHFQEWYAKAVRPRLLPLTWKPSRFEITQRLDQGMLSNEWLSEREGLDSAVDCAEEVLIKHHRPCLNITHNMGNQTPLPEHYRIPAGPDESSDSSREAALQTYVARMTELIREGLHESRVHDPKRSFARERTLAALWQLDRERRGLLLRFLHEQDLMGEAEAGEGQEEDAIISLRDALLNREDFSGVDLSGAYLRGAYLNRANLSRVNLSGANLQLAQLARADLTMANLSGAWSVSAYLGEANLSGANLSGANLSRAYLGEADLTGANLSEANLSGADLSKANLFGAQVTERQLFWAKSLEGATTPDGTVHR